MITSSKHTRTEYIELGWGVWSLLGGVDPAGLDIDTMHTNLNNLRTR